MFSSGFDEALLLSIDGSGDDSEMDHASGIVAHGKGSSLTRLKTFTEGESLGLMYGQITKLLGFREFDEYKVMGLAPYGNRSTYRSAFTESYELRPDGSYGIDRLKLITTLYDVLHTVPNEGEGLERVHRDIAAACQGALEDIAQHVLKFYARQTGLRRLAMAGGVALNCSLNGRIAASGVFDDVFVQPAAHDAGGALGAALFVSDQEHGSIAPRKRLDTVYWGSPVPSADQTEQILSKWGRFIDWTRSDRIARLAAQHLARGSVIAWVQGRAEFGPRALGNRSILADPRPAEMRDTVNHMVKKREGFRPFAPSVLEEKAFEYFDILRGYERLPFMLFLVSVRPEHRPNLGAITHVDGTARVQTVSKDANPKYWDLIREFGDITGVYMLLNTSFNNSAEPIVDSVEDAVIAYVTTGLHYLVIDDYWITKREVTDELLMDCVVTIAPCAEFGRTGTESGTTAWVKYRYENELGERAPVTISGRAFDVLCATNGQRTLRDLFERCGVTPEENIVTVKEISQLWWMRLLKLR